MNTWREIKTLEKQRWGWAGLLLTGLLGLCTPKNRIQGEEEPPVTEEDQVMELLRTLNPYRLEYAQGKSQCHWKADLYDLYHIWNAWDMSEVPYDWRKANVTSVFQKGNNNKPRVYRLVGLALLPGKNMEQILLEAASEHMKVKDVNMNINMNRTSQHGLNKGKPHLTSLIALNVEILLDLWWGERTRCHLTLISARLSTFSPTASWYTQGRLL